MVYQQDKFYNEVKIKEAKENYIRAEKSKPNWVWDCHGKNNEKRQSDKHYSNFRLSNIHPIRTAGGGVCNKVYFMSMFM